MQSVVGTEQGRVEQYAAHIVVSADQPQPGAGVVVHGVLGPEPVEPGVWVSDEAVAEEVERVERVERGTGAEHRRAASWAGPGGSATG
ncbi:hypothetical protein ACIQPP_45990 [Streptomyces violaceusniger]|uniref:hypothetical protein n=1 Tax=Streptomyces violaceusniger TaxID=68280 RepID=UPI000D1B33D8|nr:hypothetical protein [Streptomyces hygroscopicus]